MVRLYVEGGGSHNPDLAKVVRQGFHLFFKSAMLRDKPRVIACGSRNQAYESYCTAINNGLTAMLLIDSEAPVSEQFQQGDPHDWMPWEQLQSRKDQSGLLCDSWEKVGKDTDCHLMVQMMESWFLSDSDALRVYFGDGFKTDKFPGNNENIEKITKTKTLAILKSSTSETKKKEYNKGRDSFELLGLIDPVKVRARSKWAERLICLLKEKMNSV